jgi:hypothetical protein
MAFLFTSYKKIGYHYRLLPLITNRIKYQVKSFGGVIRPQEIFDGLNLENSYLHKIIFGEKHE